MNALERVRAVLSRIRAVRERDTRLDEEMRFHLDMLIARNVREGMSADEARQAALIEFGGVERFRERARDEYRSRPLEELGRDARHALRSLVRMPAFTLAAIVTLALGIGATTVMYSIVDHIVLRPLPYRDADRIVVVREIVREISDAFPSLGARGAHYLAWRERCSICEDVAALRQLSLTWDRAGDTERLNAVRVSANLFPMLGLQPVHGRSFSESEDREGANDVVMLSHAFWQREFGGDLNVIGTTLALSDRPRVIIGVLAPQARLPKREELGALTVLPDDPELYVPLAIPEWERTQGGFDYSALVRLRHGVSLSQARAYFNDLEASIAAASPRPMTLSALVTPLHEQVVGTSGRGLVLLLGAVGAVLLLVCVNLASLLLARNASRAREAAVRVALGAGRWRLVRESLTESLVLATAAGAVGLALAWSGLHALLRIAPADLPRLHEVQFDARIAVAGIIVSLLTGLLFGVLPALRTGGADPNDALRSGGRTQTEGRRSTRARTSLIAAQVALTCVLLVAAGLFLASFARVQGVDRGFRAERGLALDIIVPRSAYNSLSDLDAVYARILEHLRGVPGVTNAAATSRLPLDGVLWTDAMRTEHDTRTGDETPAGNFHFVTPDYFATLSIPLLSGSSFTARDHGRNVVVLSAHAAAVLFPAGEDPVGRRVELGGRVLAAVVGVAADVAATGIEAEPSPIVYIPTWTEFGFNPGASVILSTAGDPESITADARAALRAAGAGIAVARTRTLEQMVADATAARRFQLSLLLLFALTALLTACVGIYGVVAHSLAGRRGEIGVRMALGASRRDIHRAVLREGVGAASLGLLAGTAAALVLGLFIQSLLFDVRAYDPVIIGAVIAVLTTIATIACYIPARRASARGVAAALRPE